MNFVKSVIAHILAVFKYFTEQIIYFDFPNHALQNDIQHGPNLTISHRLLIKLRNQNVDILKVSTRNWNSNNIYLVRITFILPEKYRLEWEWGHLPLLFCKSV